MHHLPPLNALRAFEAAARHESFARASKELHVTPAAVSQQVKLLEDWLGMPLFARHSRSLTLNAAGKEYFAEIRQCLGHIARATQSVLSRAGQDMLTITAMASFASKWLVPRLARFMQQYPHIEVRIAASSRLVDVDIEDVGERLLDFSARDSDVTIRYGSGNWRGVEVIHLFDDTVFPVCAPQLCSGPEPLREPADLARHTLLHDVMPEDWPTWLAAAGVHDVDGSKGPTFSHSHDMLNAAVLGYGVALGRDGLARADLDAGRLVKPFQTTVDAAFGYYLVYDSAVADRPKVAAFRQWLLDETR